MYYFYLPFGVSGVTKYYVEIICEALREAGHEFIFADKLSQIPDKANVVSIRDKETTILALRKKPSRIITWFQGVTPEEMSMIYKGRLDRIPRILIHWIMEKYSLRKSSLSLFVSQSMKDHYSGKYGLKGGKYMIMPCFGNKLDSDVFEKSRYRTPRFLYSGSLAVWQCADKMIELFKQIKEKIPAATLCILTSEREKAGELIKQHNIDASIDFIEPDKLQQYICQFKYGFIVRDNNTVNNVATPTKMSNYMGAGIIPVYSDVVDDYKIHISEKSPYVIPFSSTEECISKIIAFENEPLDPEAIHKSYAEIFNEYWNREKYVVEMSKLIKELDSIH